MESAPSGGKPCRLCGVVKPLDDFHRARGMRDGHRSECKACSRALSQARYRQDPEAVKARVRAWQAANPERHAEQQVRWRVSGRKAAANRRSHLRTAFNLTEAKYAAMVERQGGRCAICQRLPESGQHLDIDHDHVSGAVRGLLCRQCNHALGLLADDPVRLCAAIAYLRQRT